jgi:hypothetical protein
LAHLLRKGEKIVTSKESGKRFLESTTGGKKEGAFFRQKMLQKCTGVKQQRKKEIEKIVKS